jgi:hypothetical protein
VTRGEQLARFHAQALEPIPDFDMDLLVIGWWDMYYKWQHPPWIGDWCSDEDARSDWGDSDGTVG